MSFDNLQLIPSDDPRLHTKCPEVDTETGIATGEALERFLLEYNAKQAELKAKKEPFKLGYGIAAPQVGIVQRVFVLVDPLCSTSCRVFINPIINTTYGEKTRPQEFKRPLDGFTEGCLSWSERVDVPRYEKISASYQDAYGTTITEYFRGLEAVAFQHELDHLNGINIVDHKGK